MADTLNVEPEVQEESQEHIDEMVAKAEGRETPEEGSQEESTQEEKLYADKYKTEEELQKGTLELLKKERGLEDLEALYKSLESELGKQNTKEPKDNTIPTQDEQKQEEVKEELKESPVDFKKFEQEFFESGDLSEESYKELQENGFPKNVVDNYLAGVKAQADTQAQEVFNVVDGEENYTQMVEWADKNLSDDEKRVFNQSVTSNDITQAKFAVEALYSRFTKAEGGRPQRVIHGGKVPQSNSGSFQSRAEVTEAMSNPKYESDPAFRAEVQRKLRNSDVF